MSSSLDHQSDVQPSFQSTNAHSNSDDLNHEEAMFASKTNEKDEAEEVLLPDYKIQFGDVDSKSQTKPHSSRSRNRRESKPFVLSLFFFAVVGIGCILSFLIEQNFVEHNGGEIENGTASKHGVFHSHPVVNCSPLAVKQFPEDLFSQSERRMGAVALHCLLVAYMFLGLAIVCDDYFVPTLESISEALKLDDDVAGATFMAVGSSTPELFTSLIAVFITKDDIGVGTIVGSAVFNIVFIISLCGLLTDAPIGLSWYPLIRDCSFYSLSIAALVFVIYDQTVTWYEALAMLGLYGLYILLMYVNEGMSAVADKCAVGCCPRLCCPTSLTHHKYKELALLDHTSPNSPRSTNPFLDDEDKSHQFETLDLETRESLKGKHAIQKSGSPIDLPNGGQKYQAMNGNKKKIDFDTNGSKHELFSDNEDNSLESNDEGSNTLSYPGDSSFQCKLLWVVSVPLNVLLTFTIPDCRKYPGRFWVVIASFILSTCWIAVFSYLLVWMVTVIGFTLGIPDTIMGLTLLAAGTSVPDAMSSVIVARNGQGDMAVSNSIGSNIFDILICLGLPWTLKSFHSPVTINSSGLTYISFTLITTVILIVLVIMANRWTLNKKLGVFLLFAYLLFVIYASLIETNQFGYVNPPPCPS